MTYREKYNDLINFRKQTPPEEGSYTEKHHIVPKSIAPELKKDPENIVALTGKEHFIAHYYLANAYKEEGDVDNARKMFYAMRMMKKHILKNSILNDNELQCIAEIYENSRKDLHEIGFSEERNKKISEKLRGRKLSEEQKKHLSESNKNPSAETRRKISDSNRRRKIGEETRKKMSDAKRGKHLNEEHKQHMIESRLGRHWFNNGIEQKFCKECPEGFSPGRLNPSEETRKKNSESHLNCHWWNNGIEQKYCKECPGEGFQPGMLKRKH